MREGELVRILQNTFKIFFDKFEENVQRWELRSNQWSPGSPPPALPSRSSPGPRVRLRPRGEEAEVEGTGTAHMGRLVGPPGGNEELHGAGG